MSHIRALCGHCGADTVHEVIGLTKVDWPAAINEGNKHDRESVLELLGTTDPATLMRRFAEQNRTPNYAHLALLTKSPCCTGANSFVVALEDDEIDQIVSAWNSDNLDERSNWHSHIVDQHPHSGVDQADEDWPVQCQKVFQTISKLLKTADMPPRIAIGECRTLLELITKELMKIHGSDAPKKANQTIFERVEFLYEKNVLTKPIYEWSTELRRLGNKAVHDAEGLPDDARQLFEFSRVLLDVTFTLPARIARKREMESYFEDLASKVVSNDTKLDNQN